MAKKATAKAKRINWHKRAADAEQALLDLSERMAHVCFSYEKEKATRRYANQQRISLAARLDRAINALRGAAENLHGAGRTASASELYSIASDLCAYCAKDGCAKSITKDEQI